MPKRFELIVFDWDGTLMDSAACIAASLQSACRDLGYTVPSERDARYVIGLGLNEALAHVLPGVATGEYRKVVERYRVHFLAHDGGTTLFAEAEAMVRELHERGHRLAIATGKSRRGLDRALQDTGLGIYFHGSRCADEGHCKPHPGMLQALMTHLDADPQRTLMIGDTTHDLAMAKSAGVASIAIAHGAHERAELLALEPMACVSDCIELRAWLREHA